MPEPPERLAVIPGALALAALDKTEEYGAEFESDHEEKDKEEGEGEEEGRANEDENSDNLA